MNVCFGILGCGLIADYHAKAIQQIDNATLYGAFDRNPAAAKSFCQKYNVISFSSMESFIHSQDIDAVCICLPSGLHYEAAMQCIGAHKHVVIEKPMALTSAQAEEMVQAAEQNHVFITVISQLRYSEAAQQVKKIVESGKLGTITLGNAIMKYWRSPEYYSEKPWHGSWKMDGGGALMNQGIHGVDLLQYLMGRVISVSAYAKTLVHHIETEDTLTAALEYENGALGTIQATTSVAPGYGRKIEIHGSKGSIVLCEDAIEICDVDGAEITVAPTSRTYDSANRPDGMDHMLHRAQLADFVAAITTGKPPQIDAAEGKKAIDIICAIYESAKSGRKIFL